MSGPLLTQSLLAEVSASQFAFRSGIGHPQVKALWDSLASQVKACLQRQKGLQLPYLGAFKVGPVVSQGGAAGKQKIRPAFHFLEGRFASVPQERPRHIIGESCGGSCCLQLLAAKG
jgi:hypothetical protein